jgi:hypothetical protein
VRKYAQVGPQFWSTSKTGREIRKKGAEAVVVAMYLMSSPHSNMLGLYYQPLLYMAHETGLGIEGASKGLRSCIEVGFCSFDEASEVMWVHEMALYQIGEGLKPKDKRCAGVQKEYDAAPECPFLGAFYERYKDVFHLQRKRVCATNEGQKTRPAEAPSEPLASQEQEQEQEQEPPQTPAGFEEGEAGGFEAFWAAYPKHANEAGAREAWDALNPTPRQQARMLAAVEQHRQSEQWTKAGGQFIPTAARWITDKRWREQLAPAAGATVPSDEPQKTAAYLAADRMTPEQRAEAEAARARELARLAERGLAPRKRRPDADNGHDARAG